MSSEYAFRNLRYLRMNARRQEHLASLDLPIHDKDVLEIGAGVGDLTSFFLDRGCRVTSIEPRPENIALFKAQYKGTDFWPADRLRVLQGDVYHLAPHGEVAPHAVLFCFGLLYHLDRPLAALQQMAGSCTELLILETCVSYAADDTIDYLNEDAADLTNSVSGRGCLPSRRWVYNRLSELFDYVYVPLTQPAHDQFRLDWRRREPPQGRHRAVFVAARRQLVNSVLFRGVPDLQFAELPQLGALAEPGRVSVIAPETIFGPMACFPDDLISDQMLEYGAHTRNELAMLMAFVDEGDVVYDIGAHIGTFAVPLSAAVGIHGHLIAVEADRDHYAKLVQNLTARGLLRQSTAIHAAVGEAAIPLTAQVVDGNSGATYFKRVDEIDPNAPATRGLDDLYAEFGGARRVDVLKIDVEGMELSVLRTAQSLLVRDRPILYIEISDIQLARNGTAPAEIEHLLRELGYRFFRNVGDRNSSHDGFTLRPLDSLADGGPFFDLLAVPDGHPRLERISEGVTTPSSVPQLIGSGVAAAPKGRCVYSFVLDRHPKFVQQAKVFLATLRNAGVATDNIIAHVTPSAAPEIVAHVKKIGVRISVLAPTIDHAHCNKINQLKTLPIDCETLILCDTDLAFIETPEALASARRAVAKPVDYQNPPLERLEALRLAAGIVEEPRVVDTTIDRLPTYSTNCNGGLYILPRNLAFRLVEPWLEFAQFAFERRDILDKWTMHADQIGFALAMLSLGEDVDVLPVEYNFPMHAVADFSRFDFAEPKILHYHACSEANGNLIYTGDLRVDRGIAHVNAVIAASI